MSANFITCPKCNRNVSVGVQFCPDCGKAMPMSRNSGSGSAGSAIKFILKIFLLFALIGLGVQHKDKFKELRNITFDTVIEYFDDTLAF